VGGTATLEITEVKERSAVPNETGRGCRPGGMIRTLGDRAGSVRITLLGCSRVSARPGGGWSLRAVGGGGRSGAAMTRIVAIGYQERAFVPRQPALHAFPRNVARDDLRHLVDLVRDELGRGHEVLAILPAWRTEPSLRRLQTLRAALDARRLAIYESSLPPLAGSVLCALTSALAPRVPSLGVLTAGLPTLERQLLPVAQVWGVTRVREPRPGLGYQIASLWPRNSFAVSWWPRPHIQRLRPEDPTIALPPREAWTGVPFRRLAAAAHWDTSTKWVEDVIAPALGITAITYADSSPQVDVYWGTQRVVEAVAYPTDVPALQALLVDGRRPASCYWCGATIVSKHCPFCEVDRVPAIAARHAG
jgi:hypothetical protein